MVTTVVVEIDVVDIVVGVVVVVDVVDFGNSINSGENGSNRRLLFLGISSKEVVRWDSSSSIS